MATIEERVTRIETTLEHLATKADVADLRAELKADIANLHGGLRQTTLSLVAVILVGNAATIGAVAALLKL